MLFLKGYYKLQYETTSGKFIDSAVFNKKYSDPESARKAISNMSTYYTIAYSYRIVFVGEVVITDDI